MEEQVRRVTIHIIGSRPLTDRIQRLDPPTAHKQLLNTCTFVDSSGALPEFYNFRLFTPEILPPYDAYGSFTNPLYLPLDDQGPPFFPQEKTNAQPFG